MALAKKTLVKKKVVKKKAPVAATKKAPVKKVLKKKVATKKAPVKKLLVKGKAKATTGTAVAGKGKYAYEPYRLKKNVGTCAKNACLQGKDTAEVIAVVMEEFPECNISAASVGYYRSALRKEGYDL